MKRVLSPWNIAAAARLQAELRGELDEYHARFRNRPAAAAAVLQGSGLPVSRMSRGSFLGATAPLFDELPPSRVAAACAAVDVDPAHLPHLFDEMARLNAETRDAHRKRDQATAAEVARSLQVQPARVRQWIQRGKLTPVGDREGRKLYSIAAARQLMQPDRAGTVSAAQRATSLLVNLGEANSGHLLTTAQAADLAGVSESAIRMWVKRGKLPIHRPGRPNLFLARDVAKAAPKA